jgi:hypothetical protein
MTEEIEIPGPPVKDIEVSDSPKNLKDFFTDPGATAVIGFITLLLGMVLVILKPEIKDIYMPFSMGVVGLVGGHAYTDSQKTKFMCATKKEV